MDEQFKQSNEIEEELEQLANKNALTVGNGELKEMRVTVGKVS